MHVTSKLLKVFVVDKQLRGLQTRLKASERFLAEQTDLLAQIESKRAGVESQIRLVTVAAADQEGEVKRLDARMAVLREQMNSAQTNKEYKAILTELNTIKAGRDRFEQVALEQMAKADALKTQLADLAAQKEERQQVKGVAAGECKSRAAEIKDRVEQLTAQRAELVAQVPKSAMAMLERLLETRGDEAMASVEVQDRKRHEFTCGACQMSLPIDTVSGLMVDGKITPCVSCGCLLYIDETTMKAMQPAESGKGRSRS